MRAGVTRASFERLSQAIQDATNDAVFSVGVTPDNLMIESFAVPDNPQVVEAAKLLHDRDLKSDRPGRVYNSAAAPRGRRGAMAHHATGGERTPPDDLRHGALSDEQIMEDWQLPLMDAMATITSARATESVVSPAAAVS